MQEKRKGNMLTTEEASKLCGFETHWQFRYAIKKAGIKHSKKIGMTKMWEKKYLKILIQAKKENDEK